MSPCMKRDNASVFLTVLGGTAAVILAVMGVHLKDIYYLVSSIGVAAFVISLLLKRRPTRRP